MTRSLGSWAAGNRRIRFQRLWLVLLLFLQLLWPSASRAMDLTHYDLDSLVYLSTDIVVAKMSEDAQKNLSATVVSTLCGSFHPGDRIERLSPFLAFFRPMEDGMEVILFLDRRPHKYDFFHSDAAKSLFAVPPSGVYLIDSYGHVHQYYQEANRGPYVAEGYSFFMQKGGPTQEQDLKLPSLAETESSITASLKSVQAMRPLLDKSATHEDIPQLFALLKSRTESGSGCGFRQGDAIVELLRTQIRSFDDPDLLLKLRTITADFTSGVSFVRENGMRDPVFTSARVAYLLRMLSDKKIDSAIRLAAAETLLGVSRFHSGPQNGLAKTWLVDNEWLVNSADQIRSTAKSIFDDEKENPELQSLCLQFLPPRRCEDS